MSKWRREVSDALDMGVLQLLDEVTCEGCGAPLQSDVPNDPGYVPHRVMQKHGSGKVCRRCYRISHYGKDDTGPSLSSGEAWGMAADVIPTVDACIMMIDLLDFEGSFIPHLARMAKDKLFVAANKVDLLPSKTPVEEIGEWARERIRRENISVEGVFPISATSGYGARILLDAVKRKAGKGGRVAVVGATNVGKSTLLARWLGGSNEGPTVSRFAGTTVGMIERRVDSADLVIVDTPGLSMKGRLSEMLCQSCGTNLVAGSQIQSNLMRLDPKRSIVLGGLAAMTPLEMAPGQVVLIFVPGSVNVERAADVTGDRLIRRLSSTINADVCHTCKKQMTDTGWEQVVLDVGEMDDIAVHGLGWFSPRRAGLKVRMTIPAGATVSVRPRLVGPKQPIGTVNR